ncbi:MAG: flagellin N-terminal helical domain-containing protein [Pseudomonadales bacterium]
MSMVIGTNVASLTAQRHLASSRADMETSMERLASGSRINSAMDDAAGLAITHKLDAKITGLNQGVRNANDGISMIHVAEGALEEISSILGRMKELTVQASNGTYSSDDLAAMSEEFVQLHGEITRMSDSTDFNETSVIGASATIAIQVGDSNTPSSDQISFSTTDSNAAALSVNIAITTGTLALAANAKVDAAIATVDTQRSELGAVANRLEFAVNNLMSRSEHQSAARSRIEDTDFAVESANLAKNQVLQQAGTAMLAQANASGQGVLSLLK